MFSLQKPYNVKFEGISLIRLSNGKKSPDFSIFSDCNPDCSQHFMTNEGTDEIVGYPVSDLWVDYERLIACSFGLIRLAIGIKINYDMKTDKATHEVKHILNFVNCYTWQVEKVDWNITLFLGKKVDVLRWTDNNSSGPASQFSCVQRLGSVLHRVHAYCCHIYQV